MYRRMTGTRERTPASPTPSPTPTPCCPLPSTTRKLYVNLTRVKPREKLNNREGPTRTTPVYNYCIIWTKKAFNAIPKINYSGPRLNSGSLYVNVEGQSFYKSKLSVFLCYITYLWLYRNREFLDH